MLRRKMGGFTLIELMVVIVIIGVLASLAIPRFTEASAKAKMAEAPRIIASFESGYLAAKAEGATISSTDDLMIKIPDSTNWFTYTPDMTTGKLEATARQSIGKFTTGKKLGTEYSDATETFTHCADSTAKKLIPNFAGSDISGC